MRPGFLDRREGDVIKLPGRGGLTPSVHVLGAKEIDAVNAAVATGRPLLVRGEPGVGKSQLARAAAEALSRVFISHVVDARTETRDLLYSVDAVARLAEAQVLGALAGITQETADERIDVLRFVEPGPLWWAFDWDSARRQAGHARSVRCMPEAPPGWTPSVGSVVLLDEVDKADSTVPNGLLDALGGGRFEAPGGTLVAMNRQARPLIVLTSNEERALPDAFLRRCFVLHLHFPGRDELLERGACHFEHIDASVLEKAADLLFRDREALANRDLAPPGQAEFIDMLYAVSEQETDTAAQLELLGRIAEFALDKHPRESCP